MKSNLPIIIRREYKERVYTKSFIISTIATPLLMFALMLIPSLILIFSGPEKKNIAVIDYSEIVAPSLKSDADLKFVNIDDPSLTVDSVRHMTDYDAILIIGRDIVDNPSNVQMYTQSAPSLQTEEYVKSQIAEVIKEERMKAFEIENLGEILASLDFDVSMDTFRLDEEDTMSTSSIVSYMIGIVVAMMLYMFLIIYGQMVMNSIIEEKNNRVLEIIVSSVKPQTLMLGKLIGVGLVALTQVLIWGLLIASFSRWIMPMVTAGIQSEDADVLAAIAQLGNYSYILSLFFYLAVFLILGYLFYAAIFAAIGSAVDNVQDASQLTTVAMVPIMIGMFASMSVVADPNSSFAFWASIVPFTSPMVMMARIPFGIPVWEIWVSIVTLVLSVLFMVWLAAKIYRVGIFMYGKKPSLKELIRWARYK